MSELAVINKVKSITIAKLNPYLLAATPALPTVDSRNVRIEAMDPSVQASLVVWIKADYSRFEEGSISEDDATTIVKVYLVVRGAAAAALFENLYKTAAFFRQMICANATLEGEALDATVTDFNYFDSIEGSPESRAVEITIQVSHEEPRG
jgi:hypothetical protein